MNIDYEKKYIKYKIKYLEEKKKLIMKLLEVVFMII
jgi:hypothetical protein